MNIGRAITYIFRDDEWAAKVAITAGLAFAATLTTVLGVGLVIWAALAGYVVELIRNLRDHHPTPLPRWDRYPEKISKGGSVLGAVLVYSLPNLLPLCCYLTTSTFWGDGFIGSSIFLLMLCCLTPLLLLYNLITWPMAALGLARYALEGNVGVFFQFGDLFGTVFQRFGLTLQWIIFTFLVNVVFTLVFLIPCIGWAVAPALALPVHGYLTARYADLLEGEPPPKPKR